MPTLELRTAMIVERHFHADALLLYVVCIAQSDSGLTATLRFRQITRNPFPA